MENKNLKKSNIVSYEFSRTGRDILSNESRGRDWPVVYLIRNSKEIYIGESSNMSNRFSQHLANHPSRKNLRNIDVIYDDEFNKSAVLDIEQSLIQLFSADRKFSLLNQNSGQSANHNYYQREKYLNKLVHIWNDLIKKNISNNEYFDLCNSELFKFSPYISLTLEQIEVAYTILDTIIDALENNFSLTSIVNGGAGTGKTVLAINMIFKIINANNNKIDNADLNDDFLTYEQKIMKRVSDYVRKNGKIDIAFVIPMRPLRKTIKRVFRLTKKGLSTDLVIGPSEVINKDYDVLFVDEAHRLIQRKNITNMANFDLVSKTLGFNPTENTALDWIVKTSKTRVLFYDESQTIKGSDISKSQFNKAIDSTIVNEYYLTSQLRVAGGNDYTEYISNLLDCAADKKLTFGSYDFMLFEDVEKMYQQIRKADKKYGLSRMVAGYSWEWVSKNVKPKTHEEIRKQKKEDIIIGERRYIWNMTDTEYILRKDSIEEIGCIHTIQGYDLNNVGVIFGREIDYDRKTNSIVIDLNEFYDTNVRKATDSETVKRYILNSYKVMLTRGIKGCYVYAYNDNLREYLKQFIEVYKDE